MQLVTERMEPTHFILDVMMPLLRGWNRLTYEQKLAHTRAEQAAEEAELDRLMADSLHDKKITATRRWCKKG